jgi:hypothetical protein
VACARRSRPAGPPPTWTMCATTGPTLLTSAPVCLCARMRPLLCSSTAAKMVAVWFIVQGDHHHHLGHACVCQERLQRPGLLTMGLGFRCSSPSRAVFPPSSVSSGSLLAFVLCESSACNPPAACLRWPRPHTGTASFSGAKSGDKVPNHSLWIMDTQASKGGLRAKVGVLAGRRGFAAEGCA